MQVLLSLAESVALWNHWHAQNHRQVSRSRQLAGTSLWIHLILTSIYNVELSVLFVCVWVCIHVCICVCMVVCICVCICEYICRCVGMYVHVSGCNRVCVLLKETIPRHMVLYLLVRSTSPEKHRPLSQDSLFPISFEVFSWLPLIQVFKFDTLAYSVS